MRHVKKWITILLCICLFVGPLLSVDYLYQNLHHHCTGENCKVCLQLEIACHSIANSRAILIMTSFTMMIILGTITFYLDRTIMTLRHKTLISEKVELLE